MLYTLKSIQVENTKVESILEEDIESALNDLNVNVYLNQNSDLFICNKTPLFKNTLLKV